MSQVFIESFFPVIINKLRTIYHPLLHGNFFDSTPYTTLSILFPTYGMELCNSEITLSIPIYWLIDHNFEEHVGFPRIVSIRNPILCLFAIIGAIFGLYVSLLDDTFGLIQLLHCRKRMQMNQRPLPIFYWSIAFMFFGFMNIAAIPLHCLLPMNNDNTDDIVFHRIPLPQQYPYLWIMDTFCTGMFSTSLIVALNTSRSKTNNYDISSSIWTRHKYMIFMLLCGCTATSRFLIFDSSIELELWYILPVLLAALSYARELFRSKSNHSLLNHTRILRYYYVAALLWLASGVFVDPLSCWWFMQLRSSQQQQILDGISWWWDFTRLPAIAFGACDLTFIGLYHHLNVALMTSTTNNGSKGLSKGRKNK